MSVTMTAYKAKPGDPQKPHDADIRSWVAWYCDVITRRDRWIDELEARIKRVYDANILLRSMIQKFLDASELPAKAMRVKR